MRATSAPRPASARTGSPGAAHRAARNRAGRCAPRPSPAHIRAAGRRRSLRLHRESVPREEGRGLAGHAGPPVDDRAEHIEHQCAHRLAEIACHACSPVVVEEVRCGPRCPQACADHTRARRNAPAGPDVYPLAPDLRRDAAGHFRCRSDATSDPPERRPRPRHLATLAALASRARRAPPSRTARHPARRPRG